MLQVVPINGQHAVIAAEPAVLGSQAPFQEVEDENPWLVRPAHEFDAELLAGVPLVQGDLEAVVAARARRVAVRVGPAAEAPLPQHRQLQHRARLRQHGPGVVVGHVAYVKAVHLPNNSEKRHSRGFCMFSCSWLQKLSPSQRKFACCKTSLGGTYVSDPTRLPLLSFHSLLQTHVGCSIYKLIFRLEKILNIMKSKS